MIIAKDSRNSEADAFKTKLSIHKKILLSIKITVKFLITLELLGGMNLKPPIKVYDKYNTEDAFKGIIKYFSCSIFHNLRFKLTHKAT